MLEFFQQSDLHTLLFLHDVTYQIQAMIQLWADVYLYSSLSEDEVKKAHLFPIPSIEDCLTELQHKYGPHASIAVLPEGPQTIPYLNVEKG